MVNGLIQILLAQILKWSIDPTTHKGKFENRVDLIKGQPVLYLALVAVIYRSHVTFVELNHLTVNPPIILTC
ncbi:hypothetical protein D3C74_492900 [compost metagenome]